MLSGFHPLHVQYFVTVLFFAFVLCVLTIITILPRPDPPAPGQSCDVSMMGNCATATPHHATSMLEPPPPLLTQLRRQPTQPILYDSDSEDPAAHPAHSS